MPEKRLAKARARHVGYVYEPPQRQRQETSERKSGDSFEFLAAMTPEMFEVFREWFAVMSAKGRS